MQFTSCNKMVLVFFVLFRFLFALKSVFCLKRLYWLTWNGKVRAFVQIVLSLDWIGIPIFPFSLGTWYRIPIKVYRALCSNDKRMAKRRKRMATSETNEYNKLNHILMIIRFLVILIIQRC